MDFWHVFVYLNNKLTSKIDMKPKKSASSTGKLAVGILILFIALTCVSGSQERKSVQPSDTSVGGLQSFQSESLFISLSFFHPLSLAFLSQAPAVWSQSIFETLPAKIDIVSPWKLEVANEDEYRTMRIILESIEFGGVGYIGYEHIKKYGLK